MDRRPGNSNVFFFFRFPFFLLLPGSPEKKKQIYFPFFLSFSRFGRSASFRKLAGRDGIPPPFTFFDPALLPALLNTEGFRRVSGQMRPSVTLFSPLLSLFRFFFLISGFFVSVFTYPFLSHAQNSFPTLKGGPSLRGDLIQGQPRPWLTSFYTQRFYFSLPPLLLFCLPGFCRF